MTCKSLYEKPGTCNCFAEGQEKLAPNHKPWYPPTVPVQPFPKDGTGDWVPVPFTITSGSTIIYDPTIPYTYIDKNAWYINN